MCVVCGVVARGVEISLGSVACDLSLQDRECAKDHKSHQHGA